MESSKDSPMENFEIFGSMRRMKTVQKIQHFSKNMFIDIMFNLLISFRPNSNPILWENTWDAGNNLSTS